MAATVRLPQLKAQATPRVMKRLLRARCGGGQPRGCCRLARRAWAGERSQPTCWFSAQSHRELGPAMERCVQGPGPQLLGTLQLSACLCRNVPGKPLRHLTLPRLGQLRPALRLHPAQPLLLLLHSPAVRSLCRACCESPRPLPPLQPQPQGPTGVRRPP